MKKILVNDIECTDSTVLLKNAKIEIKFNSGNFQVYGEHNDILIHSNSSNLHIYGDYNQVKVVNNNCNLHIYGDHLNIIVENNESNLHIYGTHVNVYVENGEACVYGYYGNTSFSSKASVDSYGEYKKISKIADSKMQRTNTKKFTSDTFDHSKWSNEFKIASQKKEGFRELRSEIFKGTVSIVKSGNYSVNEEIFKIDNSIINSEFFQAPESLQPIEKINTDYSVLKDDCLEVALYLIKLGLNPCVLNMANRQNPGGDVLGGAGAQEENLFRRSNLFLSLYQFAEYAEQYGLKKSKFQYPLERSTGGVYSSCITVFRGSEKNGYCLLKDSYQTSFVSVPAISNPPLVKKSGEYFLSEEMVEPTKLKIRTILRIAGKYNHDSLVLSAFGCGAFRNPPNHIALLFKEVFQEEEFANRFRKIIFAIIDDHNSSREHNPGGNYAPFKKVFGE